MPFLSPVKLLVVLVVAIVVLGPDKLPKVARQVGSLWGDFRRLRTKLETDVRGNFPDLPSTEKISQAVRSPLTFLDSLADTHEADNEPTHGDKAEAPPPEPTGDGVLHSGDANRTNGVVRADEVASIPGVSVSDPQGTVHALRSSGPVVPDDPSMNERGAESSTLVRGPVAVALSLKRRTDKPATDAMTLTEHLTELRRRVLISAAAFFVMAIVAFLAYPVILNILKHPYCEVAPSHCGFYVTGPLDGLALRIKIAAYGGIFLASPVWLWELWRFITPGLNPKEKRYAVPFIVATIGLFSLGAAVAFLIFPHALQWLDSIGGPSLTQILDPNKYLSLIILLMVAFGVTFEFPVLLVSLEVAGVLSPKQLSSWRRWAIVGIVVLAGVITPSSDPFSMLAMAIPLYVFYELSIVIGKIVRR